MNVQIPQDCVTESNDPEIVCKEKGRKITFLNPKRRRILRCKIDGCPNLRAALRDKSCKLCDFIVVDWRPEEHLVELKGTNVERALRQLESTIQQLGITRPVYCWIVTTESPRSQSKFMVLKAKFQKRFTARLTIRTNQHEHSLE